MNRAFPGALRAASGPFRSVLALAFVTAAVLTPFAQIGPATAQTILHPDPPGFIQNETSIALLPGAPGVPQHMTVAFNNSPLSPAGLGAAMSLDGGATWIPWMLPLPLDPFGSGLLATDAFDPACDYDLLGNLFVAHISTFGGYPNASAVVVWRFDTNLGVWVWSTLPAASPPAVGNPDPFYRFNDKCHLTVDRDPAGISPTPNQIDVTWIQDGGYNVGANSDIFFASSNDQSLTWQYPGGSPVPVPINDNPYVPGGPGPYDLANGPNVAVAPDGTIYVAWMDVDVTIPQSMGNLRLDVSYDGGFSWGPDQTIQANVLCCPGNLTSAFGPDARARSYPVLAVSPVPNPQGFFDVHLVYPVDPDGMGGPDEADVLHVRSTDGGATWSPPLRIHQDGTTNDQFQPWIDIKPSGVIDVIWYDRRADPGDFAWEVWIARSDDRGVTFHNEMPLPAVPPSPTPHMAWGERWMGEYPGLAVDTDFAYVAYTSAVRDSLGDAWFTKIENAELAVDTPLRSTAPELRLEPGRPNPFGETTSISFALAAPAEVRLTIHDVTGRQVRSLVAGRLEAGPQEIEWDGRDDSGTAVAAGTWFVRLETPEGVRSVKLTRLR